MTSKTLVLIELTWQLAHANRLELPEAAIYQRAIEDLLEETPMMREQLIHDFIQRMDSESNFQPSYGLKVTYLEMRDLGQRHLTTYGEDKVEELIHYLDELALVIHKKARFAVRLSAEGLQRRLEFSRAREELEQEGQPYDANDVFERAKRNHRKQ